MKRLLFVLFALCFAAAAWAAKQAPFPRKEADIGFGKTLASFGLKDVKTVHAKDFGWNAQNATRAVQKALDSKATTVVLDKMPSPWVVDMLVLRSRQRLLLKAGVMVVRDHTSPRFKKEPMFKIEDTDKVIVEGEDKKTCILAGYESAEARKQYFKGEGASCFYLTRAKNTVIRNLRVIRHEQDGVGLGGDMHVPSTDTWVEDCDFSGNARQGMSIISAKGVYCKNVSFRWTHGAQPQAGIDIEPCYPVNYNTDLYLFDCLFEGNAGGGLYFANFSQYPIRACATRCKFTQLIASGVIVSPRGHYYIPLGKKADAKLLFEDCAFESFRNVPCVAYVGAPLFDVTFRNLTVEDSGSMSWCDARVVRSPFEFELDCDYRSSGKGFQPAMTGVTTFEGKCVAKSPAKEFLSFRDELGVQDVVGAFKGKVSYNGKAFDTATLEHKATDANEPVLKRVAAAAILPKAAPPKFGPKPASKKEPNRNMTLCADGRWYEHLPAYTYYFWGEKGKPVSFTAKYKAKTHWDEDIAKKLAGQRLKVDTAGGMIDLGAIHVGDNVFSLTPKKTGWCAFHPPRQDGDTGNFVRIKDVTGAAFAWQGDTLKSSQAKFRLTDKTADYVGYFEVPPKVECRLAVMGGGFELCNAKGRAVQRCKEGEYEGRHVFTFKAQGVKPEVWSFRALPGGTYRTLRFYAPLTGIWADAPDELPRTLK